MVNMLQTTSISISIFVILSISSIIPHAHCLYEDQIGKFDW